MTTLELEQIHTIDIPSFEIVVDVLCRYSHLFPHAMFAVGVHNTTHAYFIYTLEAAQAGNISIRPYEAHIFFYGTFLELRAIAVTFAVHALGSLHHALPT